MDTMPASRRSSQQSLKKGEEYPPYPYSHPQEIQIVAPPTQFRKFGNGACLGLVGFAICTLQDSMMTAGWGVPSKKGSTSMAGQAMMVGGLAQLIGGIWQFANGNTFESAAFTSFGASWMAKGMAMFPVSGVPEFFDKESAEDANKQNGVISLAWSFWVAILLMGNVKSHIANILMFTLLNIHTDLGTIGTWTGNRNCLKVSGAFGFFLALMAFYNAAAIILTEDNFWFNLPVGHWYRSRKNDDEEMVGI